MWRLHGHEIARAIGEQEPILIPDGAVVTDQSRKVVMTVKDDGTVEPKVVRPGPMTDDYAQVVRTHRVTVAQRAGEIVGLIVLGLQLAMYVE